MDTKVIYLATNFNNKLACEAMVHIDLAPANPVPDRKMQETVFDIRTKDNSYPESSWKLVDLYRCELHQLSSIMTFPSHGVDMADYWQQAKEQKLTGATPMAVYYYKRHRT